MHKIGGFMKNYSCHPFFILSMGMFGVALLAACENSLPVQGSTLCEDADGQYLVIFHERWQGVRTSEVAEEVRAFTDRFLRDKEIPANSVTTRFEFALRGFTAWIEAEKAETLQSDSRVDIVEENRCFTAINFSTPEK